MKKELFFFAAAMLLPVKGIASVIDSITLSDTISLNEVEVVSVRAGAKTPVAHSELDQKTIESNNFGRDIPFLLTLTPSVIATSEAGAGIGYSSFRIRGTDANRINITTNGIPLNDSESHGVFWVNMPDFASSLQDLQIQRGVGTSTNGAGAFGASINMKTAAVPMKSYAEFDGGYGSFNTQKATLKLGTGKIGEHFAFDGRISSISSDGFIDRASTHLKSYFAQAVYFAENTLIKFLTFGGKEQTYHAWNGVPQAYLEAGNRTYNPSGDMGNGQFYEDQTDNYLQTHYQLSLLQRLNENFNLNLALHYTRGEGYYDEYKQNRTLTEYGLKAIVLSDTTYKKSDLVRQKWLDNDFYGGVFSLDYTKNQLKMSLGGGVNNYDGAHYGWVKWVKRYLYDDAFYPNHEYYRNRGEKFDANVYLKANYQLTKQLNLYGDLQYRFIDYRITGQNDTYDWMNGEMQRLDVNEKFNFFNPKVGAYYTINKGNTVYASFAVANREPNRDCYTEVLDALDKPRSERLLDYELGYQFRSGIFSASANLYWMQYKDQLVLNGKMNEIGEALTSNVPESYRAGVELQFGVKLANHLRWDGNVTLSDNKIKNYTSYLTNWDTYEVWETTYKSTPIAYSPNVMAGSLFSYENRSFMAALQSNYVGKQYFDNTGSDDYKIDPYFVSNLIVGYNFQGIKQLKNIGVHELSVKIMINNLFNEQYESNAFIYENGWYDDNGVKTRYDDLRYFPQAGTNVMVNVGLKF